MKSEQNRFDQLLQVRAPAFLTNALDRAADNRLTSRSNYIRSALIDRLRADGVEPMPHAGQVAA
jgi:metal-responsive CopG/Arc/MetJ family transcriptional regulator